MSINYNALDDYLDSVVELVLPKDLSSWSSIKISSPNLKRIRLSDLGNINLITVNIDTYQNYTIDVYFNGDMAKLTELKARTPNHKFFAEAHFKIRCYSETTIEEVEAPNNYWHFVHGVISPWILSY